ncbi:MAG: CBM35 domain-containing protein [Verrucomicrobiota bacterium]
MHKYSRRARLALAAGCLLVAGSIARSQPAALRFEAENQILADNAQLETNNSASGAAAVRLEDSGSIQWTLPVPAAGRYALWLRYSAGNSDKVAALSVNGRELGLGFPATGTNWAEVQVIRTLAAGSNSVTLRKDWAGLSIDYLRLDITGAAQPRPLAELPVLTPRSTIRYANNPAETRIKVDLGGHRLLRVADEHREIPFTREPCTYMDDSEFVHLPASSFQHTKTGTHRIEFEFDNGIRAPLELELRRKPEKAPWTIVTLDVNHGGATFMRLPDGKTLLLDTAKPEEADRVLLPFLRAHHIDALDYLIVTHYHDDHAGGLPAVKKLVRVGKELEYRSFKAGDEFDAGGTQVKVLNAFDNGTDENTRSLALRFEYHGFVYSHGADTYAVNQVRELREFSPELLRAHVYHANHHFHGSLDADYFRVMDPVLVLVSAERAVYARGAFTSIYKPEVESYLKTANGRLRDTLVTHDVGNIILRIHDAEHWTCETTPTLDGIELR